MRNAIRKDAIIDLAEASLADAIRDTANVFRRHRLSYQQTQYVVRRARASLGIRKAQAPKKLPKALSDTEVAAFFRAVKEADNAQHFLVFQLLWVTGARVSEFTNIERQSVDLSSLTIAIREGKGGKDRHVPIPEQLSLPLRLHMEATPHQRYLFETSRRTKISVRYMQHLTRKYGEAAGIQGMHPHLWRHTVLTQLTREKMTDAQIQLISGHSSKKSLEVYQSIALRDVSDDYQRAMEDVLKRTRAR